MADGGKLHSKVAIVTGGASGIGEATARSFAAHGARAVVIADVQDEKGQNVAVSIGPERCSYVHCEITDEEQVKTLVESTVEKYGRLDVIFSNAGVPSSSDQTVLDLDLSALERLFAVNVRGMAACVKHAGRKMAEGGGKGSVRCTASIGYVKYTDYVMSKHAVLGLVRSASLQLAPRGVRVNAVSPGPVGTRLLCDLLGVGEEEAKTFVESSVPLKIGTVLNERHVAETVSFLAFDESEFAPAMIWLLMVV